MAGRAWGHGEQAWGHGEEDTGDTASPRAHLHGLGELHLVDEEGDQVPGGDGPCGHQLSPVAEEPQLQGQRRELGTSQGGHRWGTPWRRCPCHLPRHGHLSVGTPRAQPCSVTSPVPSRSPHVPRDVTSPMSPSSWAPELLPCRALRPDVPMSWCPPALCHHGPMSPNPGVINISQPRATVSPCPTALTPSPHLATYHHVLMSHSPVPPRPHVPVPPRSHVSMPPHSHVPQPPATMSPVPVPSYACPLSPCHHTMSHHPQAIVSPIPMPPYPMSHHP